MIEIGRVKVDVDGVGSRTHVKRGGYCSIKFCVMDFERAFLRIYLFICSQLCFITIK